MATYQEGGVLQEVTVKDIHNAFYSAQDELLRPLVEVDVDPGNQGSNLKKLGFHMHPKVFAWENAVRQVNENRRSMNAMGALVHLYPDIKFITLTQVNALCTKYGLVFGPINRFVGDIPQKNINDMLKFHISREHRCSLFEQSGGPFGGGVSRKVAYEQGVGAKRGLIREAPMEIVANREMFRAFDMIQIGNQLVERAKLDPVVLMPVCYASEMLYAVVTAWGEEAKDVVNERHN